MLDPSIKTLNIDVAALLWMCVQYEMNTLISGGTASGKTSFLNAILVFTPPNQRVISIEDTRELYLPEFLHWTPLTTRLPNPEGKGEVTMLDLMINSLRMRPDRIVLGEMRRQNEAEVLFEAMHTGHAVYATIHADDARQTKNRLTQPPISLPESMLGALHLIVVQYRQRRTGIRRTFEVAEVVPQENKTFINRIFAWNSRNDTMEKVGDYVRIMDELGLFAGMNNKEISADLEDRKKVLNYMLKNRIYDVNDVGRVVAGLYRDKERLMDMVKKNTEPSKVIKMGVVR
jgi:flagellar protein FlaI